MSKVPFKFKQFHIIQKMSAMKIGTDGVLLGAWAENENPKNILDIGTGTGLVTLMLAQRFSDSQLTAIEIDSDAAEEAKLNFEMSPFSSRCQIIHTSLQQFITKIKFDLIVSNPPFFEATNSTISSREIARHQSVLTFEELIFFVDRLISQNGKFCVILPYDFEEKFIKMALKKKLWAEKILRIRGNADAPIKRTLISFSRSPKIMDKKELIIEISRHVYTEDYIHLTKEFYLKM